MRPVAAGSSSRPPRARSSSEASHSVTKAGARSSAASPPRSRARRSWWYVGPNGSGKSTLLRVLLGELSDREGEVLVDGVPLGGVSPESWRSRCVAVRQRPFLLNASLRENVLLGSEDASEEAYRAALAASGLDEVATRLPEGDATPVGPAGSLLSGGERQRAAIARALLRGADVLLLDEPATGLGPAAKASLRDLLARLTRERLVVVVDHEGVFDSVADQVIDL